MLTASSMGRLFATIYDPFMAATERACLQPWRAALLADTSGRVLEIGAGTGRSLAHYPATLERLVLAEPDRHMRARLAARMPPALSEVAEVVDAPAERLPFAAASFDVVVSSLVLCTTPDLPGALAEVHRVLVAGGRLLFLEHVADDERPDRLRWQHRLEPLWKRLAGGCHLTRRTHDAIEAAGFVLERIERASMRKANPLTRRSIRGVARKPG
jgi:ubiquinone/menaquinone biosynthesis C-methylase UbiE